MFQFDHWKTKNLLMLCYCGPKLLCQSKKNFCGKKRRKKKEEKREKFFCDMKKAFQSELLCLVRELSRNRWNALTEIQNVEE